VPLQQLFRQVMPLRTEAQRLLGCHLKRVAALLWAHLLPRAPLPQPWCLAVALPASSTLAGGQLQEPKAARVMRRGHWVGDDSRQSP